MIYDSNGDGRDTEEKRNRQSTWRKIEGVEEGVKEDRESTMKDKENHVAVKDDRS